MLKLHKSSNTVLFSILILLISVVIAFRWMEFQKIEGLLFNTHKERIIEHIRFTSDIVAQFERKEISGELNRQQAQNAVINILSNADYSSKEYVWITNPSLTMLSA
ncbi:hypothetical protein C9I98_24210 [Photobacterium sanctipauli]|uniref:Chemotaxis protein n=3 Tax=Photobacterium sanctipauli TaxID=1342794 RepID=A0A2T3NBR6_9GAMM|nr:hypothetical protein C9I98_24210 [Photobacterium sanctipauli]